MSDIKEKWRTHCSLAHNLPGWSWGSERVINIPSSWRELVVTILRGTSSPRFPRYFPFDLSKWWPLLWRPSPWQESSWNFCQVPSEDTFSQSEEQGLEPENLLLAEFFHRINTHFSWEHFLKTILRILWFQSKRDANHLSVGEEVLSYKSIHFFV